MELTLTTLLKYYVIFCLTTTISAMMVQIQAIRDAQVSFTFTGWIAYLGMTFVVSMFMAPSLFFVVIFARESYYLKILTRLLNDD